MKEIRAKFDSKCAETGITIHRGDPILWDPETRKVYVIESETYCKWQNLKWPRDEEYIRYLADVGDC